MMAFDPFIDETVMLSSGVIPASLEEVLRQSDFVSMHAPGTPEARGMMTERHFQMMKKTAIFINTGRGATVDEPALIKALTEGWIAHAGLDVLEQEPPGHNNPLLSMGNVTLSPHNASASARFDPARKRRVGQELALAAQGKWPMSCVNPSVLQNTTLRRWQPVSMERGPNS
jgi:D-3-phosphoglycerate dehydrogenase